MSSCPGRGWLAITWQLEPLDARSYLCFLLPSTWLLHYGDSGYIAKNVLSSPGSSAIMVLVRVSYCDACGCTRRHWTGTHVNGDDDIHARTRVVFGATSLYILYDAAELCCNFRGIGWNWSTHTEPLLPIKSRREFSYWCLKS
ncbi:hypothetical protein CPB85DRAFT_1559068 [Mucidula mucida]|nr:hypothetical protein CPB85DRAFT_1559068 [Mucidula mucida]